MRHTGPAGLELIRGFEALRLHPYLCPAGWWTIGYGAIHGLDGLPVTRETPPLTEEQAQALLARDCQVAEQAVLRYIQRGLSADQFDALVSFTFNLGGGALQRSTLRRCCNQGADREVPGQFLRYVYAAGRRLPGLVKRRAAEAALYGGGEWKPVSAGSEGR